MFFAPFFVPFQKSYQQNGKVTNNFIQKTTFLRYIGYKPIKTQKKNYETNSKNNSTSYNNGIATAQTK
jgi:hypothetical protein